MANIGIRMGFGGLGGSLPRKPSSACADLRHEDSPRNAQLLGDRKHLQRIAMSSALCDLCYNVGGNVYRDGLCSAWLLTRERLVVTKFSMCVTNPRNGGNVDLQLHRFAAAQHLDFSRLDAIV